MSNAQKDILSFWKDIEIFSLPDLPSNAIAVNLEQPLPWELPFTPQANSMWRHTVFLGKQSKEVVADLIDKVLDNTIDAGGDWIEKVTGNTCMAVLIINEEGCLVEDSGYLQASYLHGLKCLQQKAPLAEVTIKLQKVQEDFKERFPFNQDAENLQNAQSPVITKLHLRKEIAVLNDLKIDDIVCEKTIHVQSILVSKKSKGDAGFLNSFYLDDLNRIINENGNPGKGLESYLREDISQQPRIDILANVDSIMKTLDPSTLPAGRWPSDPSYGLYTAQVGAVHTSLQLLKKNGIIGINGPPGTGKTTLLSDVIAEVVVNRAEKLMQKDVTSLFNRGVRIDRESSFSYYFPTISDVFDDAGIVVASNNNAAVENISKELPDARKIDRNAFPDAGYFTDFSQNLIAGDSWGLLAAALGNSENRNIFKNNFWYKNGDNQPFSVFLQSHYNNPENEDLTIDYIEPYRETKTALEALLKEFNEFKKVAGAFRKLLPDFLNDKKLKLKTEQEIIVSAKSIEKLHSSYKSLSGSLTELERRISQNRNSIEIQNLAKPRFFFFQKIFNTKAFQKWNAPLLLLLAEYNELSSKRTGLQKEIDTVRSTIANKENEREILNEQLKNINLRINNYNKKRDSLHQLFGIAYKDIPDENFLHAFQNDKDVFHKCNPWSSIKINTLRSEIFLKSLKLHEYAILINAKQFKNNMGLLVDLMDGKADVSQSIALNLWKSLFFCIPVVSTSLASVGRLFGSLGKESIGWLLLDEAGQATPQSAAGIIYRAKRSIIIGDPLQIEPVVTVPQKLIDSIKTQYKIEYIWSPLRSSAQILADRITATGTWMKIDGEDDIWTGFPLRTHRRCNNPMFDISNQIAYNNQMVKAVADEPFDCVLGNSTWFDIDGTNIQNRQVVAEEINLLKEKIRLLGRIERDIFVISPFKSVADKCRQEFSHINEKIKCGTIHTFQGKEADIVFLVLGSDPSKAGSRAWASQKPNMLNVALTRAKRRFYVIGSKRQWQRFNYFSVLAKRL